MTKAVNYYYKLLCVILILILAGCQTGLSNGSDIAATAPMPVQDGWQLGTLSNNSNTTSAADAASVLLETQLRRRQLLNDTQALDTVRYEVSGDVTQWHYTGNVSPRPVVAMRVDIEDLQNQTVVWSRSIQKTGLRRQTLSHLADSLLKDVTAQIPLIDKAEPDRELGAAVALQMASTNRSGGSANAGMAGTLGLRTAALSSEENQAAIPSPLAGRAIAFYYGADPAIDILSQYDKLVLEPDNISTEELTGLKATGASTYAYLSVGEVGLFRAYAKDIKDGWVLGKNSTWNSKVLDLSNSEVREFLLNRVAQLQKAGYQGLFLDTMDSFNIVAETEEQRQLHRAGLIELIRSMGEQYPKLRLITNRGFEVLDDIAQYVEAVAAESLYASWDNTARMYTTVPENDRAWLLGKLDHAKNQLNLDVIAIDYLPPERRAEARSIALRIAEHGYIPWVANPELTYMGVGAMEVVPRKVLMLYDSSISDTLGLSPVHKFVATPVEYMGYVPEYLDIATQKLPDDVLKGRYAGVVTWSNQESEEDAVRPWLQKQLDEQLPVVFMGVPPVDITEKMMASMGIQPTGDFSVSSATVSFKDNLIQPERMLSDRVDSMALYAKSVDPANTVHMSYEDSASSQIDTVVTGPFGGFAFQPSLVDIALDDEVYWIVEPFGFLRAALQLPNVPMPDVTSENGKRLWLAHIDGDALPSWAEMPGRRLGAEVIADEILVPYKLPHSVSIVQGEITNPAYRDRRARMYGIARKIFAMDSVEIASHTYSHPFLWAELAKYKKSGKFSLNIPGYEYSPERETAGSIEFINQQLAPAGKRAKLMLWSGDALPGEAPHAIVDSIGVANMNGGLTNTTNTSPSVTKISPMALPVGKYLQVYAPITNENIYTDDWRGPFDGFKHVIDTFKLTDKPRRIKPINIYYHFYSGTKIAAMKSLKSVYDWSIAQDIYPLFGSDYSVKVPDFRKAGVARYLDGAWKLSALGNIRSIRYLDDDYWPDLEKSEGIVGAKALHDGNYLHTNGADQVILYTQDTPPTQVYLASSNGQVMRWDNKNDGLTFRVVGKVPVTIELAGTLATTCTVSAGDRLIKGVVSREKTITFAFSKKDTGNAYLSCSA